MNNYLYFECISHSLMTTVMSGCIHGYVVLGNGRQCHCDCQCQKNVLGDLLLLSLVVLMFEPNLLVNI